MFTRWPADRDIVIVGEDDPPAADGSLPGRDAAVRLARGLAKALGRRVSVALPPAGAKNVRAWLTSTDRREASWPDHGAQLSAQLLAAAVPVDPPAPPVAGGAGVARPDDRPEIAVGTDEFRVNAEAATALASEEDVYQRGG